MRKYSSLFTTNIFYISTRMCNIYGKLVVRISVKKISKENKELEIKESIKLTWAAYYNSNNLWGWNWGETTCFDDLNGTTGLKWDKVAQHR